MLTALARCCSAALTPTFLGSTSMAMSRRPPAFRAVTVPPSPGPAAIATPTGMSDGPVPATGTGATGRAARVGGGPAWSVPAPASRLAATRAAGPAASIRAWKTDRARGDSLAGGWEASGPSYWPSRARASLLSRATCTAHPNFPMRRLGRP